MEQTMNNRLDERSLTEGLHPLDIDALVEARHPDTPGGTCYIATFRDPAGNVVGLYQED